MSGTDCSPEGKARTKTISNAWKLGLPDTGNPTRHTLKCRSCPLYADSDTYREPANPVVDGMPCDALAAMDAAACLSVIC